MAEAIKRISADVYKRTDIPPIVVKQNDYNSRFLKVTVTNQGDVLSVPSTATVLLNAKRADGASASYIGTVNGDGTVTLPLSSWVLALFDYVDCSVSIVDGETKLSTMTFSLFVEPQENPDEVIDDDPNVPVLVELIEDVTELENQYEQLLTNKLITGVEYNPETGVTTFYFVDGYGNTSSFEIASQVSSVNGKTGVIVLDASDVRADPSGSAATVQGNLNTHANNPSIHVDAAQKQIWFSKYTKPSGGIPKTDLAAAVQASLDKADTALQSAPVASVNEQTGDVILTASDVGADESGAAATVQGNLDSHTQDSTIHVTAANKTTWNAKYAKPSGGIPKSDLAEAVQTSLGKADTALQSAPVSSVNNKTGAVELTYSDVGADESGAAATVQGNLTSHADNTDIHTTANEKNSWNAKYSKPSGGIPKSDLSAGVQSSLNLADTALQAAPVSSVNGKTGAVKINRYETVTLTTSWTQSGNWYTQTASLTGLTDDDLVSIQLDDSTIEALIADGVTCFKCDNVNGTATFKALGAAPSATITVQYELTVESAAT